ncbi:Cof-type HAD-IIB family hydrolase [Marinilactibacillus piezotolerans]|uniref:Cof-type HAD-IIB family hydrolase n=1 Tax=Marinilactibacillus piezotolerans TaxID=258723 RepID=UPI0009B1A227|nr:Cof-type HAD-IIB family hydrolase [Marinilactibacillus piezotolerans]
MTKKFIYFDIDGTLLTDEKTILDSTREAIKSLQEKGHEVAIATGRNALMAKELIEELDMHNYIVCNGAAGFFHHEEVFLNPLDPDAVERLIKIADHNGHQLIYETAVTLKRRSQEIYPEVQAGMNHVGFAVPEQDRLFYKNHSLTQALVFYSEEERHLYEDGQFPEFRFVRWHTSGVDVLPADGSKFETILKLSTDKGFAKKDIIAFGDGLNDYEMIKNVGLGIAMGNGETIVKEVAEMVTDTNNQDGIYKALKKLELI